MDASLYFNLVSDNLLQINDDLGRESVPALMNLNISDCKRESVSFLPNDTSSVSLQLLNDSLLNCADVNRESLTLAPKLEDWDCGRQSLGLLHPDAIKFTLNDGDILTLPEIQINSSESTSRNVCNQLNTAFLHSHSHRHLRTSIVSSTSSCNSVFNSVLFSASSLEPSEPSPIYSLSGKDSSFHNEAFLLQSNVKRKFKFRDLPNASSVSDSYLNTSFRFRIQSLPVILEQTLPDADLSEVKKLHCWSDGQEHGEKFVATLMRGLNNPDEDDVFNDSVFVMEAEHIASKIADGSILEISSGETNVLDCTPQPQWEEILDQESANNEADDVFKMLDKMFPPVKEENTVDTDNNTDKLMSSKLGETKPNFANSLNKGSEPELIQNLSGIFSSDVPVSQLSQCSNRSKSKDTRELLHNLSEILQTENRSAEQKVEGHNLLVSLASILYSDRSENASKDKDCSEDSGHSSTEMDQDGGNCRRSISNVNIEALDLSLKSDRHLSHSFGSLSTRSLPKLNEEPTQSKNLISDEFKRGRSMSVSAVDKKSFKGSISNLPTDVSKNRNSVSSNLAKLSCFGKLKPKKVEDKGSIKKGPMKAVIPVGNMLKNQSGEKLPKANTPPTNQSLLRNKRTSTPIAKPILRPVAQSTPEGAKANAGHAKPLACSSQVRKRKFDCPVSPLVGVNSYSDASTTNRSNRSGSAPDLSNASKTSSSSFVNLSMNRRRSASDLKTISESAPIKRSASISKDCVVTTTKENVSKTEIVQSASGTKSKIAIPKNRSSLSEKNSSSNMRPTNLLSKLKRSNGKENAGH